MRPRYHDATEWVVRYLNATANKLLHLGHLRNIVLGVASSASLAALGKKVIRHCIVEDVGHRMVLAMAGLRFLRGGHLDLPSLPKPDHEMGRCYTIARNAGRNGIPLSGGALAKIDTKALINFGPGRVSFPAGCECDRIRKQKGRSQEMAIALKN